jgi:hypothetical protein
MSILIVALLTVAGAELVRSSCQRLLQQPVRSTAASRAPALD